MDHVILVTFSVIIIYILLLRASYAVTYAVASSGVVSATDSKVRT